MNVLPKSEPLPSVSVERYAIDRVLRGVRRLGPKGERERPLGIIFLHPKQYTVVSKS